MKSTTLKELAIALAMVAEIERKLIPKRTKDPLKTKKIMELNLKDLKLLGKVNLIAIKLK